MTTLYTVKVGWSIEYRGGGQPSQQPRSTIASTSSV